MGYLVAVIMLIAIKEIIKVRMTDCILQHSPPESLLLLKVYTVKPVLSDRAWTKKSGL